MADETRSTRSQPGELPADRVAALQPGNTLGDFRLVRELGRGGVGVVWEAEQISFGRPVALKILFRQASPDGRTLERFKREAEACGRLQHSGIVQVLAVGEVDGVHYMAQELVAGGFTLADSLNDFRAEKKLPSRYHKEVAELFAKLADAFHHAHQRKVIHRDVKPSNILLGEGDEPKIADFGLAKVEGGLELSRTGEFMGTPFYMSPEQAAARRMGLDHRTDVFSLGASLYESLTLVRAFGGETSQEVFHKILTVDPTDPRDVRHEVPRDLATICLKALEKDPDRRYRTMADFAADLRHFLANEPIRAKPPGALVRAVKWGKRHPLVSTGALVGLGTVLVTLAGVGLYQRVTSLADPVMEQADLLRGGRIPGLRNRESTPQVRRLENAGRFKDARLLYSDGDHGAALDVLLEIDPRYVENNPADVLPYLAMCYWQAGRETEAREALERARAALADAPDDDLRFLRQAEALVGDE